MNWDQSDWYGSGFYYFISDTSKIKVGLATLASHDHNINAFPFDEFQNFHCRIAHRNVPYIQWAGI